MKTLRFTEEFLKGTITLPASKSLSNRALMIQALSEEFIQLNTISEANDTIILENALATMHEKKSVQVLDMQDAGTAFRFITAYCALVESREYIVTGTPRLLERPIFDLVKALQQLGAEIVYLDKIGFPPLHIKGRKLIGKSINVKGTISSQFISALCLISPCLKHGLEIVINGELVSSSYVLMTLGLMQQFGINYTTEFHSNNSLSKIKIAEQNYTTTNYTVESDWSSATFFFAMAMLQEEVDITLHKLQKESLQGDSYVVEFVRDFGIETQFQHSNCIIKRIHKIDSTFSKHYNLASYPDLAIPIIVACALKYPLCTFSGLHHLEWKESHRISALQTELKKIGCILKYENDILSFKHEIDFLSLNEYSFHTYDDHRMAMGLSMLTLVGKEVTLDNTECVKKSFPDFWLQLNAIKISEQKN